MPNRNNNLALKRVAHGKINLALHVTGRREDGYHLLDSLVCFTQAGDALEIRAAPQLSCQVELQINGPFADQLADCKDNIVMRAADALAQNLSRSGIECSPVSILLTKNLPVASGIGGGSADAAAVLMLLAQFWAKDHPVDLQTIALKLGADVPMCLDNVPKRVRGIGEQMTPFHLRCSLPILLVNPGIGVSTPQVFSKLANKCNSSLVMHGTEALTDSESVVKLLSLQRNDLQEKARALVPEISQALMQIGKQHGCLMARMSGSGATCFGIFDSEENNTNAMTQINERFADWWVRATNTIEDLG